jgi:flavodoxin
MRILITHFSQTGNTAKVAGAIDEAVSSGEHEVTLKTVSEVTATSLNDYDLVFLGSTCHDTDLARPAKRLLEEVSRSPSFKLAGFCTHATRMPQEDERARALYERWAGN